MRIAIVAVGRVRTGPVHELYLDYAQRIAATRWARLDLTEVEERRKLPPAELKSREAALLLAALPPGAAVVALDARGKAMTSEAFADRLGRWRDGGVGEVAFLVGGADGLAPAAVAAADLVVSLGAMTWPHMLARVMLAEQIYRAISILKKHPYHRG